MLYNVFVLIFFFNYLNDKSFFFSVLWEKERKKSLGLLPVHRELKRETLTSPQPSAPSVPVSGTLSYGKNDLKNYPENSTQSYPSMAVQDNHQSSQMSSQNSNQAKTKSNNDICKFYEDSGISGQTDDCVDTAEIYSSGEESPNIQRILKEFYFEDMSKIAGNAFDTALSFQQELQKNINQFIQEKLSSLDLVKREEFEIVKMMAEKAREENEILKKKLEEIEKKLAK